MKAVLFTVDRLFKHIEQEGARWVQFGILDAVFFQDRKDSVAYAVNGLEFHSGIVEDDFVKRKAFFQDQKKHGQTVLSEADGSDILCFAHVATAFLAARFSADRFSQ